MTAARTRPEFLHARWSAPANVVALTTIRSAPDSATGYCGFNLARHVGDDPERVRRNRHRLARALDESVDFQWLDQVHGTQVIEAERIGTVPRADAVFTTEPGLACCVLTADCLPVFFASRQGDAVAVVHAGWRGLAAGVLESTLAQFPCPASETLVWLGPAIGSCHFEVGPEVLDTFLQAADPAQSLAVEGCFKPVVHRHSLLADLSQLARLRLARMEVHAVAGGDLCTYCDAARFYSYRRENTTGRMASLIYLKP